MFFGTFSEQSFPLEPSAILRVSGAVAGEGPRRWLTQAHGTLKHLLPSSDAPALLTETLTNGDGRPVDVFKHFGIKPDRLGSLRSNWSGIAHTAQSAGAGREGQGTAVAWDDFEVEWIPGHDGLPLAGRLGWARDGSTIREADVLVMLPGILGDSQVLRTRDLAMGLRQRGFHVLALELRGHGMTEHRTPDEGYSFSSLEAVDLLTVSRWLQRQPHVRRTGLIGFCWGANHALCTAWYDGCGGVHPSVAPRVAERIGAFTPGRHFEAGVLAFSPVLQFEELLDKLDKKHSPFREPVMAGLQTTVRDRMTRKGYPEPSGSLRRLIETEIGRTKLAGPDHEMEAYQFMRMLPYRELSDGRKLQSSRVPTLIVHGANDPMSPAQDLADLIARIDNPLVAGMVLPGGGHIGFGAYAKDYYYNLIVHFFESGLRGT
ncbi:MAG: alpha/beta fold hydrolase [Planctomycetota bacterium]